MNNEIRYFSMFTGVGGFEVGLANSDKETPVKRNKEPREDSPMPNRKSPAHRGSQPSNDNSTCGKSEQNEVTKHKSNIKGIEPIRQCSTFTCVGMSEFNKYSNQVLKFRFPNIKNWGDCTKIKPEDLPDFDMLCGGFPCQAFSIAGKREALDDPRGVLFKEIARIIEVKKPKTLLLENVKGLLSAGINLGTGYYKASKGKGKGEITDNLRAIEDQSERGWKEITVNILGGFVLSEILNSLQKLGYDFQWMVLDSKFFGVPHHRERIIIIGNLRGTGRPEILPIGKNANVRNEEDQISNTITANYWKGPAGSRPFVTDGYTIRKLTPTECERLQGFPDGWTEWGIDEKGNKVKMSDTQRYKQMGNAVTTNVIAAVGSRILKNVEVVNED